MSETGKAVELLKELHKTWRKYVADADPIEWDLWDEFISGDFMLNVEKLVKEVNK